ncbi:ABC transporter substrate-binding protein
MALGYEVGKLEDLELRRRELIKAGLAGGFALTLPSILWAQGVQSPSETLRIGVRQEPDSLNPHVYQFIIAYETLSMVYDTLAGKGGDGKLTNNALAREWRLSEDGRTITVTLKPDLKWGDGTPLTVQDVVSSWQYAMNSSKAHIELNSTKYVNGIVNAVSATGPNVIEIKTEYPAENTLHDIFILPDKIWGNIGYDKVLDLKNSTPIIGSGPFILTNWTQGQSLTLQRNPNFRGPGPSLSEVRLIQFANPDSAVEALRSGEIDYMTDVPINQVSALKNEQDVVAKAFDSYRTIYLGFNTATAKGAGSTIALADPAFRDALGYAIDKQAIVDRVLQGYGTPATSMLVPAYGALYPNISEIVRQFDLKLAKEKLASAGYKDSDGDGLLEDKDGKPVRLRLYLPDVEPTYPAIAQFLTAWFHQVGVEVNTSVVNEASLLANVTDPNKGGGDYDMLIWFWDSSDPDFPLSIFQSSQMGGLNWSFWSDPEYDRMYQDYRRATTFDESAKVADKLVRKLYTSGPYHALFYPAKLHAYRTDKISGWFEGNLPPLMSGITPNPTITSLQSKE